MRSQRSAARQAAFRSVSITPPSPLVPTTSIGPVAGSAATGVPQAIDSISTRPKVSVSLGKTIASALR